MLHWSKNNVQERTESLKWLHTKTDIRTERLNQKQPFINKCLEHLEMTYIITVSMTNWTKENSPKKKKTEKGKKATLYTSSCTIGMLPRYQIWHNPTKSSGEYLSTCKTSLNLNKAKEKVHLVVFAVAETFHNSTKKCMTSSEPPKTEKGAT